MLCAVSLWRAGLPAAVKLRKIARFRAEAYKIQILPALLGSTRPLELRKKKNRKAAKAKLKGF